ncbi:rCG57716 [Rattus norvegicus]|uniref:RCG57716 n=1 Tax=Rattus norvegicus TaxID=10116 RepID=A6JI39_RAT|nr:rCG57716 [Rattus norvegicus]
MSAGTQCMEARGQHF